MSTPTPDLTEARRFLTLLDEAAERFCFQTFDDGPGKRRELARTLWGPLEGLWPELVALNEAGAGVHVAVNAIAPGMPRKNAHVTAVRAVFADFDSEAWRDLRCPLPPLIEVESSPGRRHLYWPVDGLEVGQFRPLQQAIAQTLGSDPAVSDPARVLRLPGTLHRKDPARPHLVRVVNAELAQPYAAQAMLAAFPPAARAAIAPAALPLTPGATEGQRAAARKIAFDAARRTHDDPRASRHGEIVRMAHFLRRDRIPLSRAVTELVLETFAAHMRPTDAGGKAAPMDRGRALRALRETYACPSEPDRSALVTRSGAVIALDPWPDPGEIAHTPGAVPYPIEGFPEVARRAILEYQGYGRQPLAMVADVCLAQMALATQGIADVGRDERLVSPLSLNVLIIGQSGERKTAADAAFTEAAKGWEAEERARRAPEYHKARALLKANDASRKSLERKIGALEASNAEEAFGERQAAEQRLIELESLEETLRVPPLPKLFYEDVTPEALALKLATGWPSAALVSDEGGLVVGGRGMADESALAFLTLMNRLWDGRPFESLRKQVESASIRGRRFSCSLMLQQGLLEKIAQKGGRGVGFFGRYLMTAPPSTMGTRLYTAPPAQMPALSAFGARVRALLEAPLPTRNAAFELSPPVLMMDARARAAWVDYHDRIERQLGAFGEFSLVRDVAAKSAENAVRVAGAMQVFDQGIGGALTERAIEGGIAVAEWHLGEANRIFYETDKPQELGDAEHLSQWLQEVAPGLTRQDGSPLIQGGRLPKWELARVGPNSLRRDKERREKALRALAAEGVEHLREVREGKSLRIEINPKLLSGPRR